MNSRIEYVQFPHTVRDLIEDETREGEVKTFLSNYGREGVDWIGYKFFAREWNTVFSFANAELAALYKLRFG